MNSLGGLTESQMIKPRPPLDLVKLAKLPLHPTYPLPPPKDATAGLPPLNPQHPSPAEPLPPHPSKYTQEFFANQEAMRRFAEDVIASIIELNRKPKSSSSNAPDVKKLEELINVIKNRLPSGGIVVGQNAPPAPPAPPVAVAPNPQLTELQTQTALMKQFIAQLASLGVSAPPPPPVGVSTSAIPPASPATTLLAPPPASPATTLLAQTPATSSHLPQFSTPPQTAFHIPHHHAQQPTILQKLGINMTALQNAGTPAGGGYTGKQMIEFLKEIHDYYDSSVKVGSASIMILKHRLMDWLKIHGHEPALIPSASQAGSPATSSSGTPVARRLTLTPFQGHGLGQRWINITGKNPHYFIHYPKLEGQGVLSISKRDPHGRFVKLPAFPNRHITKAFKDSLIEYLQKQRLPDLSEMPPQERDLLYQLLALAEPVTAETLNERQKERVKETKEALKRQNAERTLRSKLIRANDRLRILLGEAMAGNDKNPAILSEATKLLNLLVQHGVITREQATQLQKKVF